jgi:uncharacterized damage-inducible protein DinB
MKLLSSRFALFLFAALIIPCSSAQDATAKTAAPKPTLYSSLPQLSTMKYFGGKLTAMAEDFPDDNYDFKPNHAQLSFADQLIHGANVINIFVEIGKGERPQLVEPKRSDFKDKAAVVKYVRNAFADGAALIASKGDNGMNDLVVNPWNNQQVRLSELAGFCIDHSGRLNAALVAYYHLAGLVPPESRPKK